MTTHILTFLIGVATGAAGGYFAAKFTDQRREQESRKKARGRFRAIKDKLPKLVAEMQSDIRGDGNALVRHFYTVPAADDMARIVPWDDLPPDTKVFHYHHDEHPDLGNQLVLLEHSGYVVKLGEPTGEVISYIYRITEEFAEQLLR